VWLASFKRTRTRTNTTPYGTEAPFKQPSAVHGGLGKSATSVGLRAPAGRFDAAKGGSLNTSDGRRAVSSSPGRGPWAAGGSGEMPGDAEEGIGIEMLPLVLSLAPCGGAGCCPRSPLPWRWGRPGTIAGPKEAGGSGEMPGGAEEGIGTEMLPLVLSLAPCGGAGCCPRPPLPWRWGRLAPLLFLVFARLFLRAPFVSEPAPARPTPLSLASYS